MMKRLGRRSKKKDRKADDDGSGDESDGAEEEAAAVKAGSMDNATAAAVAKESKKDLSPAPRSSSAKRHSVSGERRASAVGVEEFSDDDDDDSISHAGDGDKKKKRRGLKMPKGWGGSKKKDKTGADSSQADLTGAQASGITMGSQSMHSPSSQATDAARMERQLKNVEEEKDSLLTIMQAKDETLRQLEQELKEARAGGVNAASSVPNADEEIHELRKTNEALKRDMNEWQQKVFDAEELLRQKESELKIARQSAGPSDADKQVVTELEAKVARAEERLRVVEQELQERVAASEVIEKRLIEETARAEAAEKEVKLLASSSQETAALMSQVASLQKDNEEKSRIAAEMEADLRDHEATLSQYTRQIENMKAENSNAEAELTALREAQEMGDRSGIEQTLTDQLTSYRNLLQQEQERSMELSQKVAEQQREMMEMRHKESTLEAKQEQLQMTEARFRNEAESTRSRVATLESDLQQAVEKLRESQSEVNLSRTKVKSLEATVESLREEWNAAEASKNSMRTTVAKQGELQQTLAELRGVKDLQQTQLQSAADREEKLRGEVRQLHSKINEAEMTREIAEDRQKNAERRIATLQGQLENLRADHEHSASDADTRVAQLQSKLTVASQKLEEMEDERRRMESQKASTESQKQNLDREIASLQMRINTAEQNLAAAQLANQTLESQFKTAESTAAAAESRAQDTEIKNRQLQETLQRQTALLDQQQQAANAAAVASKTRGVGVAPPPVAVAAAGGLADPSIGVPGGGAQTYHGTLLSNLVVVSSQLPREVFLRSPSAADHQDPYGGQELESQVVCISKDRLVEAVFGSTKGLLGSTTSGGEVETEAKKRALRAVLGRLFDDVDWGSKPPMAKLDIAKVLIRVKMLWELSEDLRLGLVQLDPSLSHRFKETKTLSSDWKTTLETLRGSAQALEERNREVETLCHSYNFAAQEARALAKVERNKAKMATAALKKHVKRSHDLHAIVEERDALLKELKQVRQLVMSTQEDNRRLHDQIRGQVMASQRRLSAAGSARPRPSEERLPQQPPHSSPPGGGGMTKASPSVLTADGGGGGHHIQVQQRSHREFFPAESLSPREDPPILPATSDFPVRTSPPSANRRPSDYQQPPATETSSTAPPTRHPIKSSPPRESPRRSSDRRMDQQNFQPPVLSYPLLRSPSPPPTAAPLIQPQGPYPLPTHQQYSTIPPRSAYVQAPPQQSAYLHKGFPTPSSPELTASAKLFPSPAATAYFPSSATFITPATAATSTRYLERPVSTSSINAPVDYNQHFSRPAIHNRPAVVLSGAPVASSPYRPSSPVRTAHAADLKTGFDRSQSPVARLSGGSPSPRAAAFQYSTTSSVSTPTRTTSMRRIAASPLVDAFNPPPRRQRPHTESDGDDYRGQEDAKRFFESNVTDAHNLPFPAYRTSSAQKFGGRPFEGQMDDEDEDASLLSDAT